MTRQQRFLLGLATGTGALAVGMRALRSRHAISFEGRVVIISGGSRGLGLVLARQLAQEGARLCLLARDRDELDRARAQLPEDAEVMTIRCDVRRRADVRLAMDTILEKWMAVDVLINNAGVIQVGPLEHMTHEDFENAMATHFWGPLHLMFEAVPSMRRRSFGRIVNIASIGGKVAVPHLAPYSASKFALVGLSDARARRTRSVRRSRHHRVPRPDADRQPDERRHQRPARARVCVVCGFRFDARFDDVGRAGRRENHRCVPVWGSRADAHRCGEAGGADQSPCAGGRRARDCDSEPTSARTCGEGRGSSSKGTSERDAGDRILRDSSHSERSRRK